jgi:hypothetical protein
MHKERIATFTELDESKARRNVSTTNWLLLDDNGYAQLKSD